MRYLLTFILFLAFAVTPVIASETSGTITTGGDNGFAWASDIGWINFGCDNCGISITDSGITGYAWNDSYGWINLNPDNGGVSVSSNGALSGYAWGENVGWINFSGVSISSAGVFSGQATGDTVGTVTFDCDYCSVTTDYRPSSYRTVATEEGSISGGYIDYNITPSTATTSSAEPSVTPTITEPSAAADRSEKKDGEGEVVDETASTSGGGVDSGDESDREEGTTTLEVILGSSFGFVRIAILGLLVLLFILWMISRRRHRKNV